MDERRREELRRMAAELPRNQAHFLAGQLISAHPISPEHPAQEGLFDAEMLNRTLTTAELVVLRWDKEWGWMVYLVRRSATDPIEAYRSKRTIVGSFLIGKEMPLDAVRRVIRGKLDGAPVTDITEIKAFHKVTPRNNEVSIVYMGFVTEVFKGSGEWISVDAVPEADTLPHHVVMIKLAVEKIRSLPQPD